MTSIKWTDTDNRIGGGAGRVYECELIDTSVAQFWPDGRDIITLFGVARVFAVVPNVPCPFIGHSEAYSRAYALPTAPARQHATHGQAWEAGMRYTRERHEHYISELFNGNLLDSTIPPDYDVAPTPLGPWVEPLFPFAEGEG